jgi:hypothetical protein
MAHNGHILFARIVVLLQILKLMLMSHIPKEIGKTLMLRLRQKI